MCLKVHSKINKVWCAEDFVFALSFDTLFVTQQKICIFYFVINNKFFKMGFSLERRWSSRTFRYGYLVTTSPQSLILPSTAASLQLAHRLRVFPTLMVWRAVCTRPGNVFTAVCWPAITSNSSFMKANFSLQSELRPFLGFCSISLFCFPLLRPL